MTTSPGVLGPIVFVGLWIKTVFLTAVVTTIVIVGAVCTRALASQAEPETGVASWYGYPYHGRQAASGEVYDMETLTAAHPTLPFNTRVRVVNLENQKSVEVRIIDRGPFIEGRIIDLSHAAARAIGMIQPGTVPARVDIIEIPQVETEDRFAAQVGAFQVRGAAEQLRVAMQERYGLARLVMRDGDPVMWRVWVGSEPTEQAARTLVVRLRQRGVRDAFLVWPGS
jgi:rare lipoprotein A